MLVDAYARRVEYLRLSLTERCNLACSYCVPHHHEAIPADWMTDDELVALVAALVPIGVRRVRLTGGEPTLRPRLPALVSRLAALGLDDLSLSTNATRLTELAAPLRDAGLHRLNISLDTLDAARFAKLSGGELAPILDGIDAAVGAGFSYTKLNIVALAGVNDGELPALARYAWDRGITPRYIELMPMADGVVAPRAQLMTAAAIRRVFEDVFGLLETEDRGALPGVGPARYLRVQTGPYIGARLGIIAAVTERFCAGCNRIRISARGRLHTCLGIDDPPPSAGDPLDLRAALRHGPDALRDAVRNAVADKGEGHAFTVDSRKLSGGPRRPMLIVGG